MGGGGATERRWGGGGRTGPVFWASAWSRPGPQGHTEGVSLTSALRMPPLGRPSRSEGAGSSANATAASATGSTSSMTPVHPKRVPGRNQHAVQGGRPGGVATGGGRRRGSHGPRARPVVTGGGPSMGAPLPPSGDSVLAPQRCIAAGPGGGAASHVRHHGH